MANLVNIQSISPDTFDYQEYLSEDISLINTSTIETSFDPNIDYIEYYIFDLNGNILIETPQGYKNFSIINNGISIDPEKDAASFGYEVGQFNTLYHFLRKRLASSAFEKYYISEISPDRTEVRLSSTSILEGDIVGSTLSFIEEIQNSPLNYIDFYLNFGSNQLVIANNLLLDESDPEDVSVLIKLYEPLPDTFDIKSECWVVQEIADSIAYNISITSVIDEIDENIYLQGPNLNLDIKDNINNSTEYVDYSSLLSTNSYQGSGSFQYQLKSALAEQGVELNIDYSNYSNFIHFSSAQTRLENFYYKLLLLEEYTISASYSENAVSNYYVSSSNNIWQDKINEIIVGFDGYEYYLYFDSGSTSWPKSNSTYPYTNYASNSVQGINWFTSQSAVATSFDSENNDALINAIPSYLREDPDNSQFELFVEMIGQHFDNIFVYLQDVTEKYNADNRLNYGVSKDLVADILRDMGIKIYQNNFSSNDLYSAVLGITPSGSLYNLPYTTGSLPTPTGWEYIDTYITASSTGSLQPVDDINKSIYKRIYHNLPYLLKKKGTIEGLRALITLYGIPDTILRINEFGGKDKNNSNDWDYWQHQYDYAFDTQGQYSISSSFSLNPSWGVNTPSSVQLRFQTRGIPTDAGYYSQSLWVTDQGTTLRLLYTGSGFTSGSYSGSIPNEYNEYVKLDFIPNNSTPGVSASVYLPFFDGDWWSAMITKVGNKYTLYAGNNIYSGSDGSQLGFFSSSIINDSGTQWNDSLISYFPSASGALGKMFSGSLQEIRYYTVALSESVFKDYVMNPYSIEGNEINSAPSQLAFRASLGGELYTSSVSIHPKVTGSWVTIPSFASNSNFYISNNNFINNYDYVFFKQFATGIKDINANKIKQTNDILPVSSSLENIPNADVLSPFSSIQQNIYVSESYTRDLDYVEVAFSPQNEINEDIISSIGYFNIGDYIGDPRQVSSSDEYYPELNNLRDLYFEKYKSNYDIWDYVRLIKYIDNSLFKLIKDFTPARTSLASGIVIKQHLLERNKYPVPQLDTLTTTSFEGSGSTPTWNTPFVTQDLVITGSIPVDEIYTVTGSNGGTMPNLEGNISGAYAGFNISPITQSWSGLNPSLLGYVQYTQSSQDEFFNGEFSGSEFIATTQSLNADNVFLTIDTTLVGYTASFTASQNTTFTSFFSTGVANGKISLFFDSSSALSVFSSPNNTIPPEVYVPSPPSS